MGKEAGEGQEVGRKAEAVWDPEKGPSPSNFTSVGRIGQDSENPRKVEKVAVLLERPYILPGTRTLFL